MFDFLIFTTPARERSLERRGLTPNDSRALFSLALEQGRPIGALARQWGCDPSNVTFIVDRLEKAGLARRKAAPEDRRVKLVVLTLRGARTRAELLEEFHVPPPQLDALSPGELETLERILRKLQPGSGREGAQSARVKPAASGSSSTR